MMPAYEYLVCCSQFNKITHVNDRWHGRLPPQRGDEAIDSCPGLAAFLQQAGAEGWELVSAYAVPYQSGTLEKLFFKRPVRDAGRSDDRIRGG